MLPLVAILAVASGGCAPQQTAALLENRTHLAVPRTAMNDTIPFIPQDELYCGPAATAMALNATGLALDQQEVAKLVYTPGRAGTLRADVIAAVRRWGRFGVPVSNLADLMAEVAAGNPVIVFQNLGLAFVPQWHFAVAVGYDLDNAEMILHSGTLPVHRVALGTFERSWARGDYWALAVSAPEKLPQTARAAGALQAAAGIARSGEAEDSAVAAFRTVAHRWPESFEAHMGLGNALYGANRAADAERAFRTAATLRPEAPEPWNNLAYALLRQARGAEARAAARKAVQLAPLDERFRDTLREISMKS
jgi:tetratricopeptide (TPR) repeat protein